MIAFAHLMLQGWVVAALTLFRRLPASAALCWTIIAGYLLLPELRGYNLPLLPTLDKDTIPAFAALGMVILFVATRKPFNTPTGPEHTVLKGWLPGPLWVKVALLALIVSAVGTAHTNQDTYNQGSYVVKPLSYYDALSMILTTFTALVPLILGRKLLAHPRQHLTLLTILVFAALAYSIPTLYEVRMSPQLNRMIYGFFGHDWRQVIRDGGFRPMVFLEHGLWLAIFMCCSLIAAVGLARSDSPARRNRWYGAAAWLIVIMILSKSLGALLIAIALVPIVLAFSVRIQIACAATIAAITLFYPMLRAADWVPTNGIANFAANIDQSRANSLQYRFDNEDILLERARERPTFGWGGWGRARVRDIKGNDVSTTDGYWVILFGEGGFARYLAEYGLLSGSILMLWWRQRRYEIDPATAALMIVLVANLVDTIPNAGLTPVTWLITGALIGRYELGRIADQSETEDTSAQSAQTSRYSRYGTAHQRPPPRELTPRQGTPPNRPMPATGRRPSTS